MNYQTVRAIRYAAAAAIFFTALAVQIRLVAADDSSSPLPRYKFEVGQQLNYEGKSNFKYEGGSHGNAVQWRVTVINSNGDGTYRLVFRCADKSIRSYGPDSKETEDPEQISYAVADVDPFGELKECFNSFGSRMNPVTVLPKLAVCQEEINSGWQSAGTFDSVIRAKQLSNENGKFIFELTQEGLMNAIYGSEQHNTVTFDLQRGFMDDSASNTKQTYGFNGEGNGDLKLTDVKTLDADACKKLADSAEKFFLAKHAFEKATQADDATAESCDKAEALFREAQAKLESSELQHQIDRSIEDFQKYRDSTLKDNEERRALLGQEADEFTTVDLDGNSHALADYRGKVVLLDFWYRGCGWCVRAMPQLKQVADHYQNKPVVLLGMNTDHELSDAKFVADHLALNYPNLRAEGLPEKFHVHGFPTMIMIDQQGKISDVHVGWSATLKDDCITKIDRLLAVGHEDSTKPQPAPDTSNSHIDQTSAQISTNPKSLLHEHSDTAAGRLLGKLRQQNADQSRFTDGWLRTLKEIIDLGPDAVPELVEELDTTNDNMMLRCLGFTLRAIDDKRAVPALIRAVPKTLQAPGSDMGLLTEDTELAKFAQKYDLDKTHTGRQYAFGRPVREIFGALQKLTGQSFNEEELYFVFLEGTRSQQRLKQELYYRTAKKWADWWDENASKYTQDPTYSHLNLEKLTAESKEPSPATIHYKTSDGSSGWVLESVLEPKSRCVFYDLDTGRKAALPEKWRDVKNIESQLDEILAWAAGEGFDMMGTEYLAPDGQRYYAMRGIGLRAWELTADRWKKEIGDITIESLEHEGTPVDGLLLHFDKQTGSIDPKAIAPFFFITREGTPGLLFVGIEVKDNSLKPGGITQGDNELDPIAFEKGRRFGFVDFEELK